MAQYNYPQIWISFDGCLPSGCAPVNVGLVCQEVQAEHMGK